MRRASLTAVSLALALSWALIAPATARPDPLPLSEPLTALSIDLNHDGLADAVSARDGLILVRLSGHSPMHLEGARDVVGLAVADIDQDGNGDVVALSRHGSLLVWRNDGIGHFAGQSYGPDRSRPAGFRSPQSAVGAGGPGAESSGELSSDRIPVLVARRAVLPLLNRAGPAPPALVVQYGPPTVVPGNPRSPPAFSAA